MHTFIFAFIYLFYIWSENFSIVQYVCSKSKVHRVCDKIAHFFDPQHTCCFHTLQFFTKVYFFFVILFALILPELVGIPSAAFFAFIFQRWFIFFIMVVAFAEAARYIVLILRRRSSGYFAHLFFNFSWNLRLFFSVFGANTSKFSAGVCAIKKYTSALKLRSRTVCEFRVFQPATVLSINGTFTFCFVQFYEFPNRFSLQFNAIKRILKHFVMVWFFIRSVTGLKYQI